MTFDSDSWAWSLLAITRLIKRLEPTLDSLQPCRDVFQADVVRPHLVAPATLDEERRERASEQPEQADADQHEDDRDATPGGSRRIQVAVPDRRYLRGCPPDAIRNGRDARVRSPALDFGDENTRADRDEGRDEERVVQFVPREYVSDRVDSSQKKRADTSSAKKAQHPRRAGDSKRAEKWDHDDDEVDHVLPNERPFRGSEVQANAVLNRERRPDDPVEREEQALRACG